MLAIIFLLDAFTGDETVIVLWQFVESRSVEFQCLGKRTGLPVVALYHFSHFYCDDWRFLFWASSFRTALFALRRRRMNSTFCFLHKFFICSFCLDLDEKGGSVSASGDSRAVSTSGFTRIIPVLQRFVPLMKNILACHLRASTLKAVSNAIYIA